MTNSAGAVQNGLVLRMSVPAAGQMAAIGPELAAKLGEQLGLSAGAAGAAGQAITDLAARVSGGTGNVEFEFHKHDVELEIVARCGERRDATRLQLAS